MSNQERAHGTVAILSVVLLASGAISSTATGQRGESLLSVPRSQDDIHQLREAQREISEKSYGIAVTRLHGLLRNARKGLYEVAPRRYLGMRTAVIRTLRELPEAGREAYERLILREAADLLESAFERRNPEDLRTLADRFPTSDAGLMARERLAELWLEAGDGTAATAEYSALLEALPTSSPRRSAVEQRVRASVALASGRVRASGDDEIIALKEETDSPIGWTAYAGGGDGSAQMVLPNQVGRDRAEVPLETPGYQNYFPLIAHAAGGLNGLYFNTGHLVRAFDPISGKVTWDGEGPMVGSWDANNYYDTLGREMLLSTAVSPDIVVAALQVPNQDQARGWNTMSLTFKLPSRRLFAFDRHTGKRLWAHWDHVGGPRTKQFAAHNAPAPPIIEGDTVYVPTDDPTGAIAYYVSAYDLATGEEKWPRTLICSSQNEVNMFGNATTEYTATPLALHEGVLYGTTNLGLCFAVEAATGRVRWCANYPVIGIPSSRRRGESYRPVYFGNNPVIVSDGVMVCTPLDSENVLAFDTTTGKILWKLDWQRQAGNRNNLKWLLGLIGDEVVLSGSGVIAVKLKPGSGTTPDVRQVRRPEQFAGLSSAIARGGVTASHIVHPVSDGISTFDPQGQPLQQEFRITTPGNLVMVDGILVSTRSNRAHVYLDHAALIKQTREIIKSEPDNPAHYLRLATLLRRGNQVSEGIDGARTIALLREGLDAAQRSGMGIETPLFRALATELFNISMLRAENAMTLGLRDKALEILSGARDESHDPEAWIKAQLKILELEEDSPGNYLEALDQLRGAHGDVLYEFPNLGRIQVRPYTLWSSIPRLEDWKTAVERCQELLEHFPDILLGDETGRGYGVRVIRDLIEEHGRDVYIVVEERARQKLEAARDEVAKLRRVDENFPHSVAAEQARQLVLDQAVLSGDLATAAAMVARSGTELSAGMLRRLMYAADREGNLPLARAIGERLLADHSQTSSDFPPDGGKTMAELVTLPNLPTVATVEAHVPSHEVGKPISFRGRTQLEILASADVSGFENDAEPPLYLAAGINTLVAFDVGQSLVDPVFELDTNMRMHWLREGEPLHLAGERLVINEGTGIRAVHYRTGNDFWFHPASQNRVLEVLAVQNGIVHVFSTLKNNADGGRVIGLDIVSGAHLFTLPFAATRATIAPRAFAGDLWILENTEQGQRIEIQRIDGVTGLVRSRFAIPIDIQSELGLNPGRSGVSLTYAQGAMLADEAGIYLCAGGAYTQPVVAAFTHEGDLKWLWKSPSPRASLKLGALHDSGIVLLEWSSGQKAGSRLLVVDRDTGTEKSSVPFAGGTKVLNPRHEPFAPDVLLLEESAQSTSLICYSLTGAGPAFRYDMRQRRLFWRDPVLTDQFLAAPVLDPAGFRMELLVIDLESRDGALPGGEKVRRLPDRGPGFKVAQHGRYILCQTQNGILVYGNEEDAKNR